MKAYLTILILASISFKAIGQTCNCPNENLNIECDTVYLKSNSMVYYQFNCDSIWLTLENQSSEKYDIYKADTKSVYNPSMLFLKQDCSQSALFSVRNSKTDLDFFLINKSNGQVIKIFKNVVDKERNNHCFIAYYKKDKKRISTYNIETGIKIEIETPEEIINNEFECLNSSLEGDSLFLYYYLGKKKKL